MKTLLLILFSSCVFADDRNGTENDLLMDKDRSYIVHMVNYIYEQVEGKSLSWSELDVLDEHPSIILPLYLTRQLANSLSVQICGVGPQLERNVDDEVDAIRHFVGSSILSFKIGENLARKYLTARELTLTGEGESEEMDLHNNEMGLRYTNEYLMHKNEGGLDSLIESIRKMGAKVIENFNLIVLAPKKFCKN
ncbi:MAG: hypothetical protein H6622_00700 [Halobacteriovoraceae bacterium]|nr:hypothetical protein [Halobacteriovoraceae bacterium]